MGVLIGMGSVKGSPGVTATALALAAAWPGYGSVLLELDPSGGDLAVPRGWSDAPGLVSLATQARRQPDGAVSVLEHCRPLSDRGMSLLVGPPGAEQACEALALLATRPQLLRQPLSGPDGVAVVVADFGRLDPKSPAWPLALAVDVLLIMTRGHATDLAHLFARITALTEASPAAMSLGVVLTGPCRYRVAEVEQSLTVPIVARLPDEPPTAAALLRGITTTPVRTTRHLTHGPLAQAVRDLVATLLASPPDDAATGRPARPVAGAVAAPMARPSPATTPHPPAGGPRAVPARTDLNAPHWSRTAPARGDADGSAS